MRNIDIEGDAGMQCARGGAHPDNGIALQVLNDSIQVMCLHRAPWSTIERVA